MASQNWQQIRVMVSITKCKMNRDNKENNEIDIQNMLYIRRDAIYTEEITPKKKKKRATG